MATSDTIATVTFFLYEDTAASVTFPHYSSLLAAVIFSPQGTFDSNIFPPGTNVKFNHNGLTGEAIVSEYYNNGTCQIQLLSCSNWSAVTDDYLIVPITDLTLLSPSDWVNY